MFKSGANPYDDIVVKTTDENLTSENWELILNLCDKVQDEGEQGARSVIAAILKRLAHRNPNVQLYSLALADSLSKNCTVELHREIASRAFTQALEKLIIDRTTHDKVRRKALSLIAMWVSEFENDPTLGVMEDCYNNLKAKNYSFEGPQEPPPPDVNDEVRRREEEELQRALEISVQDKGGRAAWNQYSLASSSAQASSSGAGSSSDGYQPPAATSSSAAARQASIGNVTYAGGYVPGPVRQATPPQVQSQSQVSLPTSSATPVALSVSPTPSTTTIVTRVRALHTFEPTEAGELAFEKGDVIKVVDRGYKDWWRGQLKGRTGIFPVNYVEPLPEPSAAELAAEAQQEFAVFSQAANVDRLLTMLRSLDPAKDNLADNEEIQELYRSSMALRPKIVKLIDKYSQKRSDLVAMNETFVKARTIFDRMMEESLARHSGYYDQRPPYMQPQPSYQPRPDSRGPQALYGRIPEPQANGWNPAVYDQPGYNAYPAPAAAYVPGQEGGYPPTQGPQPLGQPQAPYGDPGLTPAPYGAPQQQPQQAVPGGYPQQPYPAQNRMSYFPQQAEAYGPSQQPQPLAQAQPQAQPQAQAQFQPQQQPQPAAQQQAEPPREAEGPPYTFDPNATYPDPNAQAWAQYYAQGGTDPTGAVYFFSVPGITDRTPVDAQSPQAQAQAQGQPQSQSQQDAAAGYQQPYGQIQQQQSPGAGVVSPTSGPAHSPQSAHPQSAFVQAIQQQQQQQLSQPPQSQLQHQPQAQPQLQPQPQDGPQRQASASSLPSPGAYAHELPSPYGAAAAAPAPGPLRQGSLGTTYAPQSPGAAAGAGPGVGGGPAAEWANQYYGLQSQFAGMSVSGQGQGGEHGGQPQAQVPSQPPVGA